MLCNEDGKVYHKMMNESLKNDVQNVLSTAESTWVAGPLMDVVDVHVDVLDARIKQIETDFSNLQLSVHAFRRRRVDGRNHITSMY